MPLKINEAPPEYPREGMEIRWSVTGIRSKCDAVDGKVIGWARAGTRGRGGGGFWKDRYETQKTRLGGFWERELKRVVTNLELEKRKNRSSTRGTAEGHQKEQSWERRYQEPHLTRRRKEKKNECV